MSTLEAVVAIVLGVPSFLAIFAWLYKRRPERNDITITSADKVVNMSLGFASAADKANEGLREDLEALERRFEQYREDTEKRLAEMATELRAERAEKVEALRENAQLKKRVANLEAEVRELKANGS